VMGYEMGKRKGEKENLLEEAFRNGGR